MFICRKTLRERLAALPTKTEQTEADREAYRKLEKRYRDRQRKVTGIDAVRIYIEAHEAAWGEQAEIARRYGVSQATVSRIKNERTHRKAVGLYKRLKAQEPSHGFWECSGQSKLLSRRRKDIELEVQIRDLLDERRGQ